MLGCLHMCLQLCIRKLWICVERDGCYSNIFWHAQLTLLDIMYITHVFIVSWTYYFISVFWIQKIEYLIKKTILSVDAFMAFVNDPSSIVVFPHVSCELKNSKESKEYTSESQYAQSSPFSRLKVKKSKPKKMQIPLVNICWRNY